MIDIRSKINEFNYWRIDPSFRFPTETRKRKLFDTLQNIYLSKDISISISGLRRTGKTTILYQLINSLLSSGTKPETVFYFQFSEEFYDLEQVMQYYFSAFTEIEKRSLNFYIFLDELQFVKNWQNILKFYIDINKKITFISTGSASIYLNDKIKESLAGRIIDFKLNPLSFEEMIYLKDGFRQSENFTSIATSDTNKPDKFKKLYRERQNVTQYFNDYLKFGEFPALIDKLKEEEFSNEYLIDGILNKVLKKDIKLFEVEKEDQIEMLYKICCANTAQMLNVSKVAMNIALSKETINKYLLVLKKAFLLDTVKNRLRSIKSQVKTQDKVFLNSINLLSATLNITNPEVPAYLDFKGHIIETYVYNAIKEEGCVTYYNIDKKEVDLILESKGKIIPIEVKSGVSLSKPDYNHLIEFLRKYNLKEGYIVYAGNFEIMQAGDLTIYKIPYWMV